MCSKIVVGVDVAKAFSYFSIALPGSHPQKAFRVNHNFKDFSAVLSKLKELELQFNTSSVLIAEHTGHYSEIISNFFRNNSVEVRLINPILTSSIKNIDVRKIQNDKIEAKRIAELYLLGKTDQTNFSDSNTLKIKNLCRQYFDLSDDITKFKNRLTSIIDQVFPNFDSVFPEIDSKTSLFILENFNTHDSIINADKSNLILLIKQSARRSLQWATSKYEALLAVANEAKSLFCINNFGTVIASLINSINNLKVSLDSLKKEIKMLSSSIEDIKLIESIPGFGTITAAVVFSEMRSFSNFKSPKELVAFSGLDPAVLQSGTFNGTKIKMSKRGSSHIRRALFIVALASVRTTKNGKFINNVLNDFYQEKCKFKPKKVALVAVMHKLIYYVFAVLKSKSAFVITTKDDHIKKYLKDKASNSPVSIPA